MNADRVRVSIKRSGMLGAVDKGGHLKEGLL